MSDYLRAEFARAKADTYRIERDDARRDLDGLRAEVERLTATLALPCGSCRPCTEWANQTWVDAGKRLPTVIAWEDLRAERDAAHRDLAALREGVAAIATPQWRHTEGTDYSRGRNAVIDALRALLAQDGAE